MSLTLYLTEAEETVLAAKARAQGTTPEALVRETIEPLLNPGLEHARAGESAALSIAELGRARIKALQQAFEGFSDEEMMILDGIILEPAPRRKS